MNGHRNRIGEIVEADTAGFVAECYELHCAPSFGSFVAARDGASEVFAVVSNIHTTSLDPGRRALARGHDELQPEDVYRHNPELPELLRTQFEAVSIGFAEGPEGGRSVHRYLPPLPPRLHGFVYPCPAEVLAELTKDLSFLQTLLSAGLHQSTDELLAAAVREAAQSQEPDYPVRAGKELARLLMHEPSRLTAILRRIKP